MSMPLDGSAAPAALSIAPAEVDSDSQSLDPGSLDYDPETGRLYWANTDNPANISWAAADGSGGGLLTSTIPNGILPMRNLSLDGDSDKLYVVGGQGYGVATIGLDGTAGTWPLNNDDFRGGPLVDAQGGRLWMVGPGQIDWGRLDGTGSLESVLTLVWDVFEKAGFSFDRDAERLYGLWLPGAGWETAIRWTAADGSASGQIVPSETGITSASSTAIDHDSSSIYWMNATVSGQQASTRGVFKVPLTGGAGTRVGNDDTGGRSGGLLILKVPAATAEPVLTGGTTVNSELTCGDITWAGDRPEAHYFRSPVTREVAWSYNGLPIAGANSDMLVADKAGKYQCARSGTNAAGSDAAISNQIVVTDPTPPPPVCPAVKLSVRLSTFSPARPFGRRSAPGVRVAFRAGGNLALSLQPKVIFHGKEGTRVGKLRSRQLTIQGRRQTRFLLPGNLVRAIAKQRGRVRSVPVTFESRATIWRPGKRKCSQRQNLKLKTRVVYVSTRAGLRRLR